MRKARYTHAKSKVNKPMIAVIVSILCAAVMLTGALAWTDFTQAVVNRFRGSVEADVTLHDEFDGEDKDVFVENSGTSTIYVRLRLDEFMMVGDTVFATGADVRDKTTWTPHTYGGDDYTDCGNADVGKFHDYYVWEMTGRDRAYYPGVPGMPYTTLDADGKVDDQTGPNRTQAANTPITMTEFLRLEIQAYDAMSQADKDLWDNVVKAGVWILDDSDTTANGGGWAYWSQPLAPNTATNLLLDKVSRTDKDVPDDWIYRIDVKLQAVTANDFGRWHDGDSTIGYKVTDGAQILINNVLKA